jgi:hypothetical protein
MEAHIKVKRCPLLLSLMFVVWVHTARTKLLSEAQMALNMKLRPLDADSICFVKVAMLRGMDIC